MPVNPIQFRNTAQYSPSNRYKPRNIINYSNNKYHLYIPISTRVLLVHILTVLASTTATVTGTAAAAPGIPVPVVPVPEIAVPVNPVPEILVPVAGSSVSCGHWRLDSWCLSYRQRSSECTNPAINRPSSAPSTISNKDMRSYNGN